jgi:hypothetical protein
MTHVFFLSIHESKFILNSPGIYIQHLASFKIPNSKSKCDFGFSRRWIWKWEPSGTPRHVISYKHVLLPPQSGRWLVALTVEAPWNVSLLIAENTAEHPRRLSSSVPNLPTTDTYFVTTINMKTLLLPQSYVHEERVYFTFSSRG